MLRRGRILPCTIVLTLVLTAEAGAAVTSYLGVVKRDTRIDLKASIVLTGDDAAGIDPSAPAPSEREGLRIDLSRADVLVDSRTGARNLEWTSADVREGDTVRLTSTFDGSVLGTGVVSATPVLDALPCGPVSLVAGRVRDPLPLNSAAFWTTNAAKAPFGPETPGFELRRSPSGEPFGREEPRPGGAFTAKLQTALSTGQVAGVEESQASGDAQRSFTFTQSAIRGVPNCGPVGGTPGPAAAAVDGRVVSTGSLRLSLLRRKGLRTRVALQGPGVVVQFLALNNRNGPVLAKGDGALPAAGRKWLRLRLRPGVLAKYLRGVKTVRATLVTYVYSSGGHRRQLRSKRLVFRDPAPPPKVQGPSATSATMP